MFTTWTKLYDVKSQNQFFKQIWLLELEWWWENKKSYIQLDQCLITLLSMTLRFCNIHPKWFHQSLRNNHQSIGNPPPFPSKLFHKLQCGRPKQLPQAVKVVVVRVVVLQRQRFQVWCCVVSFPVSCPPPAGMLGGSHICKCFSHLLCIYALFYVDLSECSESCRQ